ncbi:MAG: hypothetical protein ACYTEQ_03620 [Planctomycetota bacterium]|jgi:hypothetical protein
MNKPFFLNPQGYTLRKIGDVPYLRIFTKALYLFELDPKAPLTFCDGSIRTQPDRKLFTDMGSTPYCARLLFPKDRYLLSYTNHDSGYKNGGLYMAGPDDKEFVFVHCDRLTVDRWLYKMTLAEGATEAGAKTIYYMVRAFGKANFLPAEETLSGNIK